MPSKRIKDLSTTLTSADVEPDADYDVIEDDSADKTARILVGEKVRGGGALMRSGVDPMTGDLDMGGQAITNVGLVDGVDLAAAGTKLASIEAGANVTNSASVEAAGALMRAGGTMTGDLNLDGDRVVSPTDKADGAGPGDTLDIRGGQGSRSGALGQVGGALTLEGGAGGDAAPATNGTGGAGADLVLRGGAGGALDGSGADGADGAVSIGETQTSAIASGDGSTVWTHDGDLVVTGAITAPPKAIRTESGAFSVDADDHDRPIRYTGTGNVAATFNEGLAGQFGAILLTGVAGSLTLSYIYITDSIVAVTGGLVAA